MAKQYNLPLLYSGGNMFASDGDQAAVVRRHAVAFGVPANRFFVEDASLNTTQSVQMMLPILQREGWQRPVVVTSAYHMPRSVLIFQAAGVDVQPWPCDFRRSLSRSWTYMDVLPNASALETTSIALRELLGILSLRTPYAQW